MIRALGEVVTTTPVAEAEAALAVAILEVALVEVLAAVEAVTQVVAVLTLAVAEAAR